jgi:putative ABC transport system permease protein
MTRQPLQYLLLILGVALGVAMMVSVDLANGAARRAFQLSTDAVAGRSTHRITGASGTIDEAVYRRLVTGLGYRPAAPVVEGYVLVPELGNQPLRLFAEPPFRDYLAAGRSVGIESLTALIAEPNTVVLAAGLAERFEVALGDPLTLDRAGRIATGRVAGLLMPADGSSLRALENLIFTDIASAQEILDLRGRLSHVDLIAADPAVLTTIAAALPRGTRIEPAAARSNALQQMAAAFELNLTALSLLALVVGMFLIYNTVTFSVVQRRALFGILRSLGATGQQLVGLILGEAAALSLVGALLGLGAGVLLGRGMVRLVSQTINDFYFVVNVQSVDIPPAALLRGLVIGVAAAVGSAVIPAWEALRTTPQNSLRRSTLESRARRLAIWLLPAFALVTGAGAFLLWLPGANLIFAFAGLFAVLIGSALLVPAATLRLMSILGAVLGRPLGAIGRLAPRDIARSLSRTSVAIAALMIAVAVIVGVSVMIGSFRQTVAEWLDNTLQADVYLSAPTLTSNRVAGPLNSEVVELARNWPGVAQAVAARRSDVIAPDFGRPVEVIAVDGDVSRGRRTYAWLGGERETVWQRLERGEGVLMSEPLLIRQGLPLPPPPLTLLTDRGPRDFPVLGVFYDYASDQGSLLMDHDLYAQWWGEAPVTTMGLFVAEGQEADRLAEALQTRFSGRTDVVVQSNRSVRGNALDIFDRTFAITAALQLLAIVVAFIGVLSALLSLQLERTREIGVLRATGMTVGQLWQLTLLETGLMGATAGLLALPVGWVLAWILIYVINRRSFGWTLQMDLEPRYFWQALAVALVAALLAGIYPALRSGRLTIAGAIREE